VTRHKQKAGKVQAFIKAVFLDQVLFPLPNYHTRIFNHVPFKFKQSRARIKIKHAGPFTWIQHKGIPRIGKLTSISMPKTKVRLMVGSCLTPLRSECSAKNHSRGTPSFKILLSIRNAGNPVNDLSKDTDWFPLGKLHKAKDLYFQRANFITIFE